MCVTNSFRLSQSTSIRTPISSYKELLPLVPCILNSLYRIYTSAYMPSPSSSSYSIHSTAMHHTIIELCLSVPSRLATLLPHLPLLFLMVTNALQSSQGYLINIGLRSFEFWLDNLHADYLFGVLMSMDTTTSSADGSALYNFMDALTSHLRPAPYPYGMLVMRILGKMGGMNRLHLREMVAIGGWKDKVSRKTDANVKHSLNINCEWQSADDNDKDEQETSHGEEKDGSDKSFPLPLPLERAVDILRCVAAAPCIVVNGDETSVASTLASSTSEPYYQGNSFRELLSIDVRKFDLNKYTAELMEETKMSQSRSAFAILRAALASVIDIDDEREGTISICAKSGVAKGADQKILVSPSDTEKDKQQEEGLCQHYNDDFKRICDGLYAASVNNDLNGEAVALLQGLGSHLFYYLLSHRAVITRIDRNGCSIDTYYKEVENDEGGDETHTPEHKPQSLKSFGCFRFSEELPGGESCRGDGDRLDPFIFNEALVDALTDEDVKYSHVVAIEVMDHIIALFQSVKARVVQENTKDEDDADADNTDKPCNIALDSTWGDVLMENLLKIMCKSLSNSQWNLRSGVMAGLNHLITTMGYEWAEQYETEILQTVLFVVNDTPEGIAYASKESMNFFLQVTWFFFGGPADWEGSDSVVKDVLCPMLGSNNDTKPSSAETDADGGVMANNPVAIKDASLNLILAEIASTKPLVR